jgi:hypothetical protein
LPANFSLGIDIGSAAKGASLAGGVFHGLADSNLAADRYTIGNEVVSIGDVISLADPALFDPALDIDAGGVKPRDSGFVDGRRLELVDPIRTTMLTNGWTIVLEVQFETGANFETGACDATNTAASQVWAENLTYLDPVGTVSLQGWDYADYLSEAGGPQPNQLNKLAATVTSSYMSLSLNGGAVKRIEVTGLDATATRVYFGVSGELDARLRRFTIYEPQADAELPALSSV